MRIRTGSSMDDSFAQPKRPRRLHFKDGLVWRSRAYESVDAARAAYTAQGVDVDI
jgi:hypothetical protein